jgi:hypothetical protein
MFSELPKFSRIISAYAATRPELVHAFKLSPYDASHFVSISEVLLVQADGNGQRRITCHFIGPEAIIQSKVEPRVLWAAESAEQKEGSSPLLQLTSIIPLDLDLIILGYSTAIILLTFKLVLT